MSKQVNLPLSFSLITFLTNWEFCWFFQEFFTDRFRLVLINHLCIVSRIDFLYSLFALVEVVPRLTSLLIVREPFQTNLQFYDWTYFPFPSFQSGDGYQVIQMFAFWCIMILRGCALPLCLVNNKYSTEVFSLLIELVRLTTGTLESCFVS